MTQGALKAFVAEHPQSGHSAVIFAETRGKARASAVGMDHVHDCEFLDIIIRRAKELDGYQQPPTLKQLVEQHEWWCECHRCGKALHIDQRPVFTDDSTAYCNADCVNAYQKWLRENTTPLEQKTPGAGL